jgi:uncharacterized membrane protein
MWDWLRLAAAVKMFASSLDTVFIGVERFKPFARPAYAVAASAALLGVAGALLYGYRLLAARRAAGEAPEVVEARGASDERRVYAGLFYFDPSDPALFARKHLLNLGNKWAWALAASVAAYPLLVFMPA